MKNIPKSSIIAPVIVTLLVNVLIVGVIWAIEKITRPNF